MKKFLCIVCSLLFLGFCPIRALPVDAARAVYAPTDLKIDQTTSGGTLTVTGSCTARPDFTARLELTLQVYQEDGGWANVHTRAQWELHDGRHTATIRSLYPIDGQACRVMLTASTIDDQHRALGERTVYAAVN